MAICPFAVQRLLPENNTQAPIEPRVAVAHTAVDAPGPSRLWKWFGRPDIKAETHFWIDNEGTIYQMMDTNVEADAMQIADKFGVSYETEDDGDPEGNPWTEAQLESIIELNVWLVEAHPDIIPEVVRTPRGSGLGWHSMWGFEDPWNLEGPKRNPWSSKFGKTCPGRTRIHQFVNVVVPAVQARLFGDDMFDDEARSMLAEVRDRLRADEINGPAWHTGQRLKAMQDDLSEQQRSLRDLPSACADKAVKAVHQADPSGLTPEQVRDVVDAVVTAELRKIFKGV